MTDNQTNADLFAAHINRQRKEPLSLEAYCDAPPETPSGDKTTGEAFGDFLQAQLDANQTTFDNL